MPPLTLGPNLGPLSNREVEYRRQNILTIDGNGRLRFSPLIRRDPTVPPEILAEIFCHCLPDDEEYITPDLITPLILCWICRQWRELALSTPRLWSSLCLDFDLMIQRGAYETDFWRTWLSRAGGTPLSVILRSSQHVPAGPIDLLLKTVIGLSQQWRRIEFTIEVDLARFIFPLKGSFPLLETVDVFVLQDDLSISFSEAPKLRGATLHPYNPHMQVPWNQLTTLWSYRVNFSSCIQILRDSPNLVFACFQVEGNPPSRPYTILHHSRLRKLQLGAVYKGPGVGRNHNPMPVLDHLKITTLRDFTLDFVNYPELPPADISPFLSFISRAFANFTRSTSSIVHLKLTLTALPDLVDTDAVFAQFTHQVDFLPKLEIFHIFFPATYDLSRLTVFVLVQMLCWRWAAVGLTRLRAFRLGHYDTEPGFDKAVIASRVSTTPGGGHGLAPWADETY
ncbi:hypothetical protein DFH06DRAFT_1463649 [Mycena polygramma]|nr:hypothetical protein DFH06DRAFT_1463649 [Mycena polygramma]